MGPILSIEQNIVAGAQFTKASPTGALTQPSTARATRHDLYRYASQTEAPATDAVGGLFLPTVGGAEPTIAWRVKRVTLNGAALWRVDIIDQAGAVRLADWINQTVTVSLVTDRFDEILLMPGEKLGIYTTGAVGALIATVMYERC